MGSTELDRFLEICTHSHAELEQIVALGNLRQERKVHCRLLVDWRQTHEPHNRQSQILLAKANERICLARCDAALLRLPPGVHLYEELKDTVLLPDFRSENRREFRPINRMNYIE